MKKDENEKTKMISFRIPVSLREDLSKYAHVTRITQTNVIISALEKVLYTREGIGFINQYDSVKENENRLS